MRIGNFVITYGPQSFRLAQLEAALARVRDKANVDVVVDTIKGLVFDTFGLENGVPADIAADNAAAESSIESSKAGVVMAENEINALKQRVANLEAQAKRSAARQARLAEIAKLFGTK